MSTTAIREALDMLEGVLDHPNVPLGFHGPLDRARAEVEAIDKAVASHAERYEGLWDIVHELKERPCENGNDCRPKVAFQHPCLPCAARMEWEAR